MKKGLILITICLVLVSCEYSTTSSTSYDSIKDISQNPDAYKGKEIVVRGVLESRVGGPSMADSEGYWIWLDDDTCEERQRNYELGKTYVATGEYLYEPGLLEKYGITGDEKRYLKCSLPLS